MNPESAPQGHALTEQWSIEFVRVMQAMGDVLPAMELKLAPPSRESDLLWWSQPIDLAPGAAVWIGTSEKTWSALGQRILAAAGVESSGLDELKDTYLEVLRQSIGALATGIGSQVGREISATAGTEQEPAADLGFGCQVGIRCDEKDLPPFAFYLNHEMLDALPHSAQQAGAVENPAQSAPGGAEDGPEFCARAYGNLDLLLDVEMPVSVSFGRTQARVQNILKLISGSIIELDRAISEPVEVIVNNCTIARGEVVVVDGNYGVRIIEVMSRKERLQESRKYLLPASSNRR